MLERRTERRATGDTRQNLHRSAHTEAHGTADRVARGHRRSGHAAADAGVPVVFVADRDAAARCSLELLLRQAGWRVEAFGPASHFLAHPRPPVSSCLVLDVASPDGDVFELLERLARERSEMPVIVTARSADVPTCAHAMKCGALDFHLAPFAAADLLDSIAFAIARSERALRERARTAALRERHASLSPRERDVMALVVSGLLNKQIGGELGIREITVKAHRGSVMRKMQADSLAALVTIAACLGLAPVASRSGQLETRTRPRTGE
jgi:FixJ family two-component response regulator